MYLSRLKKDQVKKSMKTVKYKDWIKTKKDDKPIFDEDEIKKVVESLPINPR